MISKKSLLSILLASTLLCAAAEVEKTAIHYNIQKGAWHKVVELYDLYCDAHPEEAGILSAHMVEQYFKQTVRSSNDKQRLLALHASGIVACEPLLGVFEKSLRSNDPKAQCLAVEGLKRLKSDLADRLLLEAMHSEYAPVCVGAAIALMERNNAEVPMFMESLMYKVPPAARVLFPAIFGKSEHPECKRLIGVLLKDRDPLVRISSLLAIVEYHFDTFIPQLRTIAAQGNSAEKELAIYGLALFEDSSSLELLQHLAEDKDPIVRMVAALGLNRFGVDISASIEKMAKERNLWAISALGRVEGGGVETLKQFVKDPDLSVRATALWALLERKDSSAVEPLIELVCLSSGIVSQESTGTVLKIFKPGIAGQWRAPWVAAAAKLPMKEFIIFAKRAIAKDKSLANSIITLLENSDKEEAKAFIRQLAHYPGERAIRYRAQIALLRLDYGSESTTEVMEWLTEKERVDLWTLTSGEGEQSPLEGIFVEGLLTIAEKERAGALPLLWKIFAKTDANNRPLVAAVILLVTG